MFQFFQSVTKNDDVVHINEHTSRDKDFSKAYIDHLLKGSGHIA
jgi:hypothetical protein